MRKRFTKIICALVALVCAFGVAFSTGCGQYFNSSALPGIEFTDEFKALEAESNGGFAVKKGDYVYFVNGIQSNTADNNYGTPVKGAIYRVSAENLAAHNYSSVDCVVPLVAYTSDYNSGLFIYGNYIYFATPSTNRDAEGKVLNENLELKRAKLDGTEAMSDQYIIFPSLSYEFRFVEDNGVVYILYVATEEKLFKESTGVKNLHSLNTETGDDTLLAYNVGTVLFDCEDKTNPQVFYTMNVKNYSSGTNYGYNQVYRVSASATEDKFEGKLDSDVITGWNDDEDDDDRDRYVNCGELVFDGIGYMDEVTPFNYAYGKTEEGGAGTEDAMRPGYTYTLAKYQKNTLFYTRKSSNITSNHLFMLKESQIGGEDKTPVTLNPAPEERLLTNGSSAANYTYVFEEGELSAVLFEESAGGISVNKLVDGKLQTELTGMTETAKYFKVVQSGVCTILFVKGNYLYYSVSGGNGYSFNRVDYTGNSLDYTGMPGFNDDPGTNDYTAVKILDLDASSGWFKPEMFDNQLIFASENDSDYLSANYIAACDLRYYDETEKTYGALMTNKQLEELNKKFEGVEKLSGEDEDEDKEGYANLTNALEYCFHTDNYEYIEELAAACNAKLEDGETAVYSDKTLAKIKEFLTPDAENGWKDYTVTRKVNGEDVYANRRAYYYATLGEMAESDKDALADGLKSQYLKAMPEDDAGWFDSLSDGEKAGFIIGIVLAGLLIIGGVTVAVILVKRKKSKALQEPRKRKIKVDTYDDKNIDVYGDGTENGGEETSEESVADGEEGAAGGDVNAE